MHILHQQVSLFQLSLEFLSVMNPRMFTNEQKFTSIKYFSRHFHFHIKRIISIISNLSWFLLLSESKVLSDKRLSVSDRFYFMKFTKNLCVLNFFLCVAL
jgi:hypothetical protein